MVPILLAEGFTNTELALGSVILTLAGVIVGLAKYVTKLNDKIETMQESRRQTEVDAYKELLPLTSKIVEVMEEIQPILERISEDE